MEFLLVLVKRTRRGKKGANQQYLCLENKIFFSDSQTILGQAMTCHSHRGIESVLSTIAVLTTTALYADFFLDQFIPASWDHFPNKVLFKENTN